MKKKTLRLKKLCDLTMTIVYFRSGFGQFKAIIHRISKLSSEATITINSSTMTIYFEHGHITIPIQACITEDISIKVNTISLSKSLKNISNISNINHIDISFNKISIQSKESSGKKEYVFKVEATECLESFILIKTDIDLYPCFDVKKLIWICEKITSIFVDSHVSLNKGIMEVSGETDEYKTVSHIDLSSNNHDTIKRTIPTQKLLNMAWILEGISQSIYVSTDPHTFQIRLISRDSHHDPRNAPYVSMIL